MLLAFLFIYIMHIITDPAVKQDILDSLLKAAKEKSSTAVDVEQNSKKTVTKIAITTVPKLYLLLHSMFGQKRKKIC